MNRKFDPRRFLEFSKELLQTDFSNDDEAKYRTINGRCYYAAFLYAIEQLGLEPEATHRKVQDTVMNLDRKLGKELTYLWIYRLGADYYLETPALIATRDREGAVIAEKNIKCNEEEARESIARTERFLKFMET
ncbi:MAG TPA: hypothetical protein C5S37_07035 [Methanophagales archaeon]|nr:hypothetical protein [Methanophagales archaeon]